MMESVRYWERRRIAYNLLLLGLVAFYGTLTWPHFRPALSSPLDLLRFAGLGALANIGYSAAYLPDLVLQSGNRPWRRWLFAGGTLFAMVLTLYWMADEIYPAFG